MCVTNETEHMMCSPFIILHFSIFLCAAPFFYLFVKSPTLGAQSSVYLAVAKELEGTSGRYYDAMTEKDPAPHALDENTSERLWDASIALLGLNSTQTVSHAHPTSQSAIKAVSSELTGDGAFPTMTSEPIKSTV